MQYAIWPSKYVRQTQGIGGNFSHKGTMAIDEAGKDAGIDVMYAPCDIVLVKKTNEVLYFNSVNKIHCADGVIDYINFRVIHMDDISKYYVGQRFNQGQEFYKEGTKGHATGNHMHIQVARGLFKGILKNVFSKYMLIGEIHPNKVFSLLDGHNIVLKTSYTWNKVNSWSYNQSFPVLKKGAKGEYVRILQTKLKEKGYVISVDGSFGPKTLSAVKQFQKNNKLVVDGIVGPKTWGKI